MTDRAPVALEPVTDRARYGEAIARVDGLATRGRFAEAEEQIRLILSDPDPYGGVLEQLADDLGGIALASRPDAPPEVYRWLRDRAISLWYAWGRRQPVAAREPPGLYEFEHRKTTSVIKTLQSCLG